MVCLVDGISIVHRAHPLSVAHCQPEPSGRRAGGGEGQHEKAVSRSSLPSRKTALHFPRAEQFMSEGERAREIDPKGTARYGGSLGRYFFEL